MVDSTGCREGFIVDGIEGNVDGIDMGGHVGLSVLFGLGSGGSGGVLIEIKGYCFGLVIVE